MTTTILMISIVHLSIAFLSQKLISKYSVILFLYFSFLPLSFFSYTYITHRIISNKMLTFNCSEEIIDISEDTVSNNISEDNNNYDVINNLIGKFERVKTQSIMWDIEINPKDNNVNLIYSDLLFAEDGNEDLKNSIGYMMTFFHQPSV